MIKHSLLLGLFLSFSSFAQGLAEIIPAPFYVVQNQSENQLTIIDNGLVALQLRLDMIARAKKSIELEYYIYKTDRSGKLMTLALIEAAKRGVKIRFLMDKTIVITELNSYHAEEFKKAGIEFKFYNALGAEYALATQFRNHRKLLVVDDKEALTGGRNIGEDYFNMDEHMNYTDRDVHVKGPMAKVMRESFDAYFESIVSTPAKEIKVPSEKKKKKFAKYLKETEEAQTFISETPEIAIVRAKLESLSRPLFSDLKVHTCPETTYATDAPGFRSNGIVKPSEHKKYRFLRQVIFDRIGKTDKELTIASPYMINNHATLKLMEETIKRAVKINLSTNSLASTDALYMVANTYAKIRMWSKLDVMTYLHSGLPMTNDIIYDDIAKAAKWGVHEKSMVFESKDWNETMIGSYNIDNRSYHFNTELAIFCRGSDEMTNELKASISSRNTEGLLYTSDGKAMDKDGAIVSIYGNNKNKLLLMKFLSLPSRLIQYFL